MRSERGTVEAGLTVSRTHSYLTIEILAVRGESPASTETVPAPAGQGAIRVHTGSMCPNRNAVRRDAGTVECRDDFCHGLLGANRDPSPSRL